MSATVEPATDARPEIVTSSWPVRVWPGVLIVLFVAFCFYVPVKYFAGTQAHMFIGMFGPILSTLFALFWWTRLARVSGWDRWLFPALFLVPLGVLCAVDGAGMMFQLLFSAPFMVAVWVGWLALTLFVPATLRRSSLAGVLLLVWGLVGCVRYEGVNGKFWPIWSWRWQPTAEQRSREAIANRKSAPVSEKVIYAGPGDWEGFRGPDRDGRVAGVKIDTEWKAHKPHELWKQRVGPGWGSFAVAGDYVFTQEQRGADGNKEAVVCFKADSGAQVWAHEQDGRFEEKIAGPGPRATPTLHDGRIYAQMAIGKLVCLDAATGTRVWAKDLTEVVGGRLPIWGYSGSPLVYQGMVFVYAGGTEERGMAAFKADTGDLVWANGKAAHSYSSVHRATLDGVAQVLLVSDYGVEAFAPADGKLLWEHNWLVKDMQRVTQPILVGDSDVVVGTGIGGDQGSRRLHVTHSGDKWDVKVVWSTKDLKPYFNDAVLYQGYAYGFSGSRFCCIDMATGKRKWSEDASYGSGQVLLLADQGLLVVQAENGSVALVKASPDALEEVASFDPIEGNTWNHPVVAQGKLFVRNGAWAACYELAPAK